MTDITTRYFVLSKITQIPFSHLFKYFFKLEKFKSEFSNNSRKLSFITTSVAFYPAFLMKLLAGTFLTKSHTPYKVDLIAKGPDFKTRPW